MWSYVAACEPCTQFGISQIIQVQDGGYVFVGTRIGDIGSDIMDINLVKISSGGIQLWDKVFGSPSLYEEAHNVIETESGDLLIIGSANHENTSWNDWVEHDPYDILLIKTDSNGNEYWSNKYWLCEEDEIESQDKGNYVQETLDGGYITGVVMVRLALAHLMK